MKDEIKAEYGNYFNAVNYEKDVIDYHWSTQYLEEIEEKR